MDQRFPTPFASGMKDFSLMVWVVLGNATDFVCVTALYGESQKRVKFTCHMDEMRDEGHGMNRFYREHGQ